MELIIRCTLFLFLGLAQFCLSMQESFISEKDFITLVGKQGKGNKIRSYLESGGDINAQDKEGMTALQWAARNGNQAIVESLIQAGANINIQNNRGKTALHFAASHGFPTIALKLLYTGADTNRVDKHGQAALHLAVKHNHLPIVQYLIELQFKNLKINAKDYNGITPLLFTSDPDIFTELIKNGADISAKDNAGRSILHHTTNPEVIKLVLEHGLDPNLPDKQGKTPLIQAVIHGNVKAIPILLQHGAKVNLKDTYRGRTPLLWALRQYEKSVIHEEKGSPEYLKKEKGRLPLDILIKIIKALGKDPSLDIRSEDKKGHNIYYYINSEIVHLTKKERQALIDVLDKIQKRQKS